jgi:spore germination cell wall hydrolase CwlJ-like protein
MNRIVRAAGLAAAVVALAATTAFASPSAVDTVPVAAYTDHQVASLADGDLGLNEIDVAPASTANASPAVAAAPAAPAPTGLGQLFRHAVAVIAGDKAEEAAPVVVSNQQRLDQLVASLEADAAPDTQQDCLAKAVYFEARGEPIEGQLAVAEVVLNRAASGRYPTTICEVVTQPAQFSFIRHGRFPQADKSSESWRKAVAIACIARQKLIARLPSNVLWYHATYVSPSWGKNLSRTAQIGLHIFYS